MKEFDLIVIGAGPGGYVAAIRGAQLGMKVAVVEKAPALGGTCLRVGCIPSKALLESSERFHSARHELASHGVKTGEVQLDLASMMKRKDQVVKNLTGGVQLLLKQNKIERFGGHGRFLAPGEIEVPGESATEQLKAPHVIIATGSQPVSLPGIELDGNLVGTSTEALSYPEVPKHLVVIGAGYIGLELGSVWQRLGAKVTVVEYLNRILPGMDEEVAKEAQKVFTKQGLIFRLGSKVQGVKPARKTCKVLIEDADPVQCDRVLVAVGRRANTEGLGLDAIGLEPDQRGRVSVDEQFRTPVEGIYAIGDVIRGPMLAHKAEEEGVACVEYIAGQPGHVDYDTIPGIVYTHPEIATVGKTEEQLNELGIAYQKGIFPFAANGRAYALGDTTGRVKILADEKTDRVLGVHIIGPRAGDLIAEATAAMTFGASSEDIARCIHAHPTLSESIKEAAMAVTGRALHTA